MCTDAVVESVTAHAQKGAGTKTTLCGGQEEDQEVEEEVEEVQEVGGGMVGCAVLGRGAEPPPILGVVNMVGTRTFRCYMGAL